MNWILNKIVEHCSTYIDAAEDQLANLSPEIVVGTIIAMIVCSAALFYFSKRAK